MFKIFYEIKNILSEKLFNKIWIICFILIFGTLLEMMSIGVLLSLVITIFGENLEFTKNLLLYLSQMSNINDDKYLRSIILLFVLVFFILKNVILYLILCYKNKFVFNVNRLIAEKLYFKYINSKYNYYFSNSLSTITRTIENDALSVSRLTFSILTIITEVFTILGLATILFLVNFQIALTIFILGVLLGFIYFFLVFKKIKRWGILRQIYLSQRLKIIQETIIGIKEIFIFNAQKFFQNKFEVTNKAVTEIMRKDNNLLNFPRYLFEIFIIGLILVTIFILINYNFTEDQIILTLTVLITSASRIFPAFTRIISAAQNIKFNRPALIKINQELNNIKKIETFNNDTLIDNKNYYPKEKIINELEVKNFSYSYENKKTIIEKSSFKLKKNNIYEIRGESGSGKTTLLNFISGLLESSECKILLNGKLSNQNAYKHKVGYVPQNVFLFDDTIENNIAFGLEKGKINYEKIDDILKKLKLDKFTKFNSEFQKNETYSLGDSGNKVSGGQRQRIGIARTLYFDPEILIFDETTNALDFDNENKIVDIIYKNKQNKITLIVSHSKNVTKICDEVIEIKNNKIYQIQYK